MFAEEDVMFQVKSFWDLEFEKEHSVDKAYQAVINTMSSELEDPDDSSLIWLSLALLFYEVGESNSAIIQRAFDGIEYNKRRWMEEASPEACELQINKLAVIQTLLTSTK